MTRRVLHRAASVVSRCTYPIFSGIIFLFAFTPSCSNDRGFEIEDMQGDGSYEVVRYLQPLGMALSYQPCPYMPGISDCESFFESADACFHRHYGDSSAVDSLLARHRPAIAISDWLGFGVSDLLMDHFLQGSHQDIKGLNVAPLSDPRAQYTFSAKGDWPAPFMMDSTKHYGNRYFADVENYSLVLLERWDLRDGEVQQRTIQGLQLALNAREDNRLHPIAQLNVSDLPQFLNRNNYDSYLSNQGFPDTLLASVFPYVKDLTLAEAYGKNLMILHPHSVDGKLVQSSDALQLMLHDPRFQPARPKTSELKGEIWAAIRFFDPSLAFGISEGEFAKNTQNGTLDLPRQLNGMLGTWTDSASYRENLLLSYRATDALVQGILEQHKDGKLPFYNPDSILSRRVIWEGPDDYESALARIMKVPFEYDIEFLARFDIVDGKQQKDLHAARIVVTPYNYLAPARNMFVVLLSDIQGILGKTFGGQERLTLGQFFQNHAFYEVYNLNGKGARTHQDAKNFLSILYSLHPTPLSL